MIAAVLAHAGHWLAQVAYVVPLVLVVIAIVVNKVRERRADGLEADGEGEDAPAEPAADRAPRP